MADQLSPQHRSWNMSRIRAKDMKPEMLVRRLVHSMGYRYRLHRKDLPGKPDLVFPGRRKVIFVHGCFWHQHNDPACKISRKPKSNQEYWLNKLERNIIRDAEHQTRLQELGWDILVIWECEVKARHGLEERLRNFLEDVQE
ncbi:very short patch repair endonuclease [Emcibacter sp.]|uniref:very short patch repair endonuclease n=1 Tax=Emcibacter sp. TaxID=1979954 RepID=UPI003A926744